MKNLELKANFKYRKLKLLENNLNGSNRRKESYRNLIELKR
jgi:hypothetical protein